MRVLLLNVDIVDIVIGQLECVNAFLAMKDMLVRDVSFFYFIIYKVFRFIFDHIYKMIVTCGQDKCSGHGTCTTIGNIYDIATRIHRTTDTYTPWEADRVTSCVCDMGYTGASCEMSKLSSFSHCNVLCSD